MRFILMLALTFSRPYFKINKSRVLFYFFADAFVMLSYFGFDIQNRQLLFVIG